MSELATILVANRGEIACRILRTVRAMGLKGAAVYSEADAGAPHVMLADQALCIGPPPAGESYLDIARMIEAAWTAGADAVHPGYGFLAENAAFAEACTEAGLVFIGPPARAIELMGNKAEAKRLVLAAGVPCVPGYSGEQSDEALIAAGEEMGFPLMVKAAAGGGGRGMRLVADRGDLPAAIRLARSEAQRAFGSGELILEQAIVKPRHVEFQVLADSAGHTVHLGERDCSVQRRHQKIIEEAPCPVLTAELRKRMGSAAVRAAEVIDYRGAGTVEFLLAGGGDFYFLEMNTRLQVEHPVTELVTGLDLVELQIRIARGESLGLTQDALGMRGHAIEARLYTEDPVRDFMPTTGRIERWQPANGDGVRIDAGIREGQEISPYYDALAAKVIAWGATRDIARRRLIAGLESTVLFGPRTNRSFLIQCLKQERFAQGEATTDFVAEEMAGVLEEPAAVSERDAVLVAAIMFRLDREAALAAGAGVARTLLNWSSGIRLRSHYRIESEEALLDVSLSPCEDEHYLAISNGRELAIEILAFDAGTACVSIDGQRIQAAFCQPGRGALWLSAEGRERLFSLCEALRLEDDGAGGGGRITAAVHGVIRELAVEIGKRVEKGERLLVMEAMKMQQEILAPVAGEVAAIHVREGQQVATGDMLVTIEAYACLGQLATSRGTVTAADAVEKQQREDAE